MKCRYCGKLDPSRSGVCPTCTTTYERPRRRSKRGQAARRAPLTVASDHYVCADCGRDFGTNGEARDLHFMSDQCPKHRTRR